jgi:hypothetical protein
VTIQPKVQLAFTHTNMKIDGSFDSICPQCFARVAHHLRRREVDSNEQEHACLPWVEEQYRDLSEAVASARTHKRKAAVKG